MKAIIKAAEEHLPKLRNIGVEIVCTDRDAVISEPFTYKAIQAEIRRYLHIYGSGKENVSRIAGLTEDVICRMRKALQAEDGSLCWDEVWEIIAECCKDAKKKTKSKERGMRICPQRNSSARTARISPS